MPTNYIWSWTNNINWKLYKLISTNTKHNLFLSPWRLYLLLYNYFCWYEANTIPNKFQMPRSWGAPHGQVKFISHNISQYHKKVSLFNFNFSKAVEVLLDNSTLSRLILTKYNCKWILFDQKLGISSWTSEIHWKLYKLI